MTLRIPWLRYSPYTLPDHQPFSARGLSASARAGMAWCPVRRKEMLSRLCGEQNHRCCYCFVIMDGAVGADNQATIEHIISVSLGGSDDWTNLAAACLRCNTERGLTAVNYVQIRATQPVGGIATLGDVMPEGLRRIAACS